MHSLPPWPSGRRSRSRELRAEADRWRRRAEEAKQWGNEDLAALRVREYLEQAERLDSAADAAERKEGRR